MQKYKNKVFNIDSENIFPPNQVFLKHNFDFLLTIGGNLVDNEIEYNNLMNVLKKIGETEFYILENTNDKMPFFEKVSVNSNFDYFQNIGKNYDLHFGWSLGDFFIFGENDNWGIYICECPAINIIGCDKKLINSFQNIYGIKDNGYDDLKEFISKEFQQKNDLINLFEKNYNLCL